MKQFSIFNKQITVPGLRYIPEYITLEQETLLIEIINSMPWDCQLKRRTQHYGYKYDYTSKSIDPSYYLDIIPAWLNTLCDQLYNEGIFEAKPDQVIVNEYMPGQGIAAHIDCIPCFSNTICSLSLASHCMMDFINSDIKHSIMLESRSLLILQDDARYKWKHGISPRKSDNGTKRQRRISLTFRKILMP